MQLNHNIVNGETNIKLCRHKLKLIYCKMNPNILEQHCKWYLFQQAFYRQFLLTQLVHW